MRKPKKSTICGITGIALYVIGYLLAIKADEIAKEESREA